MVDLKWRDSRLLRKFEFPKRKMIVTLHLYNLCIHTRHKEVGFIHWAHFLVSGVSAGVIQHECNNHSSSLKARRDRENPHFFVLKKL
jgi:hypothetical protein